MDEENYERFQFETDGIHVVLEFPVKTGGTAPILKEVKELLSYELQEKINSHGICYYNWEKSNYTSGKGSN